MTIDGQDVLELLKGLRRIGYLELSSAPMAIRCLEPGNTVKHSYFRLKPYLRMKGKYPLRGETIADMETLRTAMRRLCENGKL